MPDMDILAELNRWLAITPEYALTAPPLRRNTLAAAVREIRSLRERVATLEQHTGAAPAGDGTGLVSLGE